MSERKTWEPCVHARPQADSQLHGICIFCYRDRLGETSERERRLEAALLHILYTPQTHGTIVEYIKALLAEGAGRGGD